MGTYGGIEQVIHLWDVGKLTTEQVIGQILQLMREMEARIKELENLPAPPQSPPRGGG